jgi:uncharacterized protein (TIGR04255 family)
MTTSGELREKQFRPLHSGHAIEQVAFSLKAAGELDETALIAAGEAAKAVAGGDLPKFAEIRVMMVSVGPEMAAQSPNTPLAGYQLQKFRTNGIIESELRVERSSLLYLTTQYSRWATVWEQARKYLVSILPKYAGLPISALGLNYVDKFIWDGPIEECEPARMLMPASPYLTPHIYKASDLWHSHTGAFLRHDARTKRLLNVNVDYLDEQTVQGPRRSVAIKTVLTDMLNQAGYERCAADASQISEIFDAHMQSLHAFNKQVIASIISPEMSRRIALEI